MTIAGHRAGRRPVVDGRRAVAGRALAVFATVSGFGYLVWRLTATRDGAPGWLFWPALLVETALWVRFLLVTWSLWRAPATVHLGPLSAPAEPGAPHEPEPVDVLVTTLNDPVRWLRRTLVACRALRHAGTVWVLDDGNRPEVADMAAGYGARYHARPEPVDTRAGNVNLGLVLAGSSRMLLLQPGDVPMPDALDHLLPVLDDDPAAAVVLGGRRDWNGTTAWSNAGADDDDLELGVRRACLDPRGALGWEQGPALVRRDALLTVDGLQPGTLAPDLHAGIRLQQLGWRIRSCPVTVFETPGRVNLAATLIARERSSCGRLGLLATRENPLVARGLPWRVRVAHLEELSAIAGGLVLLTGRPPLVAGEGELLRAAGPWVLSAGAAHQVLARGRAGFPDGWLRAVRRAGPDLYAIGRALVGRAGVPRYLPRTGDDPGGMRAVLRMTVPTLALLVMMVAAIVRLADEVFDMALLPGIAGPTAVLAGVVGGATALAIGQVLGLVARRRRQRSTRRLVQQVDASLDGHPAVAVDLAPAGAGLRTSRPVAVGQSARVTLVLCDVAGVTRRVTLPAEVRHGADRSDGAGRTVVGVRFLPGPAEAEDALLEYCAVVVPYRELRARRRRALVDPFPGTPSAGPDPDAEVPRASRWVPAGAPHDHGLDEA